MFLREGIGQNNELLSIPSFGSQELVAALRSGLQSDIEMFDFLADGLLATGLIPLACMVKHRAGILRDGLQRMAEEASQ